MNSELKKAGEIVSVLLEEISGFLREGITTGDINRFAEDFLKNNYPQCSFPCKGYHGFPASLCVSVNEEVIHGIPGERVINGGDLVKVDAVVENNGWFADSARTYAVGEVSEEALNLMRVGVKALDLAIEQARPNNTTGDIGYATQKYVEESGFSVMRKYCGHGIGRAMHMEPAVPNFGSPGQGEILKKGMFIAIEPMIFMGSYEVYTAPDGWTVISRDKSLSVHFEHTIMITDSTPLIITA